VLFECIIIVIGYLFLMIYLYYEQKRHSQNLSQLNYRIHVNGIRGKSSVTRLIGQIMRENGIKTFTKTTGSAARLIDHHGNEYPIKRRTANISEQVSVIKTISQHQPEAFVTECMAVNPQLQRVCEEKMLQATIGVLTNVREDHQETMGWTLHDITHSLCEFIPTKGILVCGEHKPDMMKIIRKRAQQLGTKVIFAPPYLSPKDKVILQRVSYIEHEENISLALKVAEVLGINKQVALAGILNAQPDPGVLRIFKKQINGCTISFINAHAINDKESLMKVFQLLKERGHMDKTTIGVLFNRYDRPERVTIFADAVSQDMHLDAVILLGYYQDVAKQRLINGGFPEERIFSIKKAQLKDLLYLVSQLTTTLSGTKEANLIGMVNIHGHIVEQYIHYFSN
jgi:poly-gamma-glutamate synthase PgsB/CapB